MAVPVQPSLVNSSSSKPLDLPSIVSYSAQLPRNPLTSLVLDLVFLSELILHALQALVESYTASIGFIFSKS